MPVNQQEQYKKINVEDMFKVNPDNLPKPPENWRNKMVSAIGPEAAQATKIANVNAESPDIFYPKAVPAFSPQSVPSLPIQSNPNFFPQWAPGPNRPQGPQNLSRNDRNPPGHGAFIPLQATRNQAKASKEQDNWRSEERKVMHSINCFYAFLYNVYTFLLKYRLFAPNHHRTSHRTRPMMTVRQRQVLLVRENHSFHRILPNRELLLVLKRQPYKLTVFSKFKLWFELGLQTTILSESDNYLQQLLRSKVYFFK